MGGKVSTNVTADAKSSFKMLTKRTTASARVWPLAADSSLVTLSALCLLHMSSQAVLVASLHPQPVLCAMNAVLVPDSTNYGTNQVVSASDLTDTSPTESLLCTSAPCLAWSA